MNHPAPQLSVIIPTYNSATTVLQTLASLWEQTFQDFEIIVVDDGSTDHTLEVLAPYTHKVRLVALPHQGIGYGHEHGLQIANGKYITFCDADDYYLQNDFFEKAIVQLNDDPHLDAIHSGWVEVDEQGQPLVSRQPWEIMPDLSPQSWIRWPTPRIHALIVKREIVLQVGGITAKGNTSLDVALLIELALAGCRFAWYRELAVAYVLHSHSTTAQYPTKIVDDLIEISRANAARPDLPADIDRSLLLYYRFLWAAWYLFSFGGNPQPYWEQSRPYRHHPTHSLPFEWASIFSRTYTQYPLPRIQLLNIIPYLKDYLPNTYPFGITSDQLLGWWLEGWWWIYAQMQKELPENFAKLTPQWDRLGQQYHPPIHYIALSLAVMPGLGYEQGWSTARLMDYLNQQFSLTQQDIALLKGIIAWRSLRQQSPITWREVAWLPALKLLVQLRWSRARMR